MSKKSNIAKIMGATAVGVGLGFLFAPKSGKETRQELNQKIHELTDKVKNINSKKVKKEFQTKIKELEKELKALDKEKAFEIARTKVEKIKQKADNLVDLAIEEGNEKLQKQTAEVKNHVYAVTEKILEKLENA